MLIPRFSAQVDWASEREAAAGSRLIHPVWFPEDGPDAEGWSLIVTLMEPVQRGDVCSKATVHFLMPAAPHHHLQAGRVIAIGAPTGLVGNVMVGEPIGFIDADS